MVFSFGELLLRMSPVLDGQWINQQTMPVYVGGAELNVATALAKWEVPVRYGTALPDNYLSKEIMDEIRGKGIDTTGIQIGGDRIGIYYLPQGADLKNAGVIYDRAHSSFSGLKRGNIDWPGLLKDCSWFHFSAISPALNEHVADVCLEALEVATSNGLRISVDLNYRSRLWKYGKRPADVMPELVRNCHVIMGNVWSAADLLGIPVDKDIHEKRNYAEHARSTSNAIMQKFSSCDTVANTFRFDHGKGIRYFATLDTAAGQVVSPQLETDTVIDKVGSGDCFMAGLIYGLYNRHAPQDIIDFAAAAAFGKLQEKGDTTSQTVQVVKNILRKEWTGTKI